MDTYICMSNTCVFCSYRHTISPSMSAYVHVHIYTYIHMVVCMPKCNVYLCTYIHVCLHTYMHKFIHPYAYTEHHASLPIYIPIINIDVAYIHVHIWIDTYIPMSKIYLFMCIHTHSICQCHMPTLNRNVGQIQLATYLGQSSVYHPRTQKLNNTPLHNNICALEVKNQLATNIHANMAP